jgi:hypothetical protein
MSAEVLGRSSRRSCQVGGRTGCRGDDHKGDLCNITRNLPRKHFFHLAL